MTFSAIMIASFISWFLRTSNLIKIKGSRAFNFRKTFIVCHRLHISYSFITSLKSISNFFFSYIFVFSYLCIFGIVIRRSENILWIELFTTSSPMLVNREHKEINESFVSLNYRGLFVIRFFFQSFFNEFIYSSFLPRIFICNAFFNSFHNLLSFSKQNVCIFFLMNVLITLLQGSIKIISIEVTAQANLNEKLC